MTDWRPIDDDAKTGAYFLLARHGCGEDHAMEGFWRAEKAALNGRIIPAGFVLSIDPDTPYPIEPYAYAPLPTPPPDGNG